MSKANRGSPELQGKPGTSDLLRVTVEDEGIEVETTQVETTQVETTQVETTQVCRVCGTGPNRRVSIWSRDEHDWYMVHVDCLSELVDLRSQEEP